MRFAYGWCITVFAVALGISAWSQQAAEAVPAPADATETQQEIAFIESLLPRLADHAAAQFQLAHDYAHLRQVLNRSDMRNKSRGADKYPMGGNLPG
jgi:hypothetical protein